MPDSVKQVDKRLLATECRDLMGKQTAPWDLPFAPYEETIRPSAKFYEIELAFMLRFEQLVYVSANP